jgi:hypothetical protein
MRLPTPKSGSGDFAPAPAGAHRAVCTRFIDLGTQDIPNHTKGTVDKVHKVAISWELVDEPMQDGRPFMVSARYTWSMHERANLRKMLETWRGRPYTAEELERGVNTQNLLGVPALVTVQHASSPDGSRTYANVAGVSPLPKGMERPRAVNAPLYLALDREEFKQSVFDELHDNLKMTIAKSPEYQALGTPGAQAAARAHGASPRAAAEPPRRTVYEREPGDDADVPFKDQDPFNDEIPF